VALGTLSSLGSSELRIAIVARLELLRSELAEAERVAPIGSDNSSYRIWCRESHCWYHARAELAAYRRRAVKELESLLARFPQQ
jgi:hypothetical protein